MTTKYNICLKRSRKEVYISKEVALQLFRFIAISHCSLFSITVTMNLFLVIALDISVALNNTLSQRWQRSLVIMDLEVEQLECVKLSFM